MLHRTCMYDFIKGCQARRCVLQAQPYLFRTSCVFVQCIACLLHRSWVGWPHAASPFSRVCSSCKHPQHLQQEFRSKGLSFYVRVFPHCKALRFFLCVVRSLLDMRWISSEAPEEQPDDRQLTLGPCFYLVSNSACEPGIQRDELA